MDWWGWATFGFVATVVLTVIMVAAQLVGLSRMDIPMMLGTMFVESPDLARVIGFLVHLINGQAFALLYAAAFALIGSATWWLGALFGLVHGFAALTVIIPYLPGIHPRMASARSGPDVQATLEPPGPLALNYGTQTPVFTLIAHVVYGTLLGAFLKP
jgi:uncharacterized membrane protein YagU involved in acid resistance